MTTFVASDTEPDLTITLANDGVPTPLAGATVRFHILKPDATVINALATSVATGSVAYQWQTGDLNQPGDWQAEVEITYAGGGVETSPRVYFVVRPQIA